MNMSIEAEFLAGTSIEQSIMEARALAKKLGLAYIKYTFNGVSMSVGKNADTTRGAEQYREGRKAPRGTIDKYVVVNS